MRKILQIIFCVLAVLCLAAGTILGVFYGLFGFLGGLLGAAVFALLMLFAKYGISLKEKQPPKPDFMNSAEENEKLREEQEQGRE